MALAARAYACFGVALIAVHLAVGGSVLVYELIGLSSVVAVAAGVLIYKPEHRLAWWGIGAAQALFWAGDVVDHAQANAAFPTAVDVLYLLSYAVFIPSIVLLLDRDFPWRDWAGPDHRVPRLRRLDVPDRPRPLVSEPAKVGID